MPPLDFPSSPTNGQEYQGYVYSTSVGAWQAKPAAQSPFYTSDTPPANPTKGDSWFNTNDGTMYVYVYDGNTFQWVEHRSQIARSQVGLVPIAPSSVTTSSGSASVSSAGVITLSGGANTITLNNIFSSLYRNYLVQVNMFGSTSSPSWFMRFSSGGTPIATASYMYSLTRLTSSATIANQYYGSTANGIYVCESDSAQLSGFSSASVTVFNPFLTQYTTVQSQSIGGWSGAGYNIISSAGVHDNVSRDGFCIYSATGTITSGTIQVYGYNQ